MVLLFSASRYLLLPVQNKLTPLPNVNDTKVEPASNVAICPQRELFTSQEELSELTLNLKPRDLPLATRLNDTERDTLIGLVKLVKAFLESNEIAYVLGYHSLLGSYVMHDLLPHDDTVQLLARTSYRRAVSAAVAKDADLDLSDHTSDAAYTHVRFFAKTREGTKRPVWPFVELHYYDENSTHAWTMMPDPGRVEVKIEAFYPVHDRPLARLWMPVPRDPLTFLLQTYSSYEYVSFDRDHRFDVAESPTKIPWGKMLTQYPFVHRISCGEGVKETLIYHRVEHYSVYIDEYYFPHNKSTAGLR